MWQRLPRWPSTRCGGPYADHVQGNGGPAVLREGDAREGGLPDDLRGALREWAEVAETVLRSGDVHEVDLLRRRGRQLASRVADVLGRPVEFVDPVSGAVESVRGAARADAGSDGARPGSAGRAPEGAERGALALEAPGPTPWGTGMAVSAFFAVLVAIANIVLADAFAGAFGLLWVPANLLVTAGTMPSLWLAREVPFWRWPAFGAAVGLAAAWIVLLLGLLGP
jgi:Protein of unknown function (DUF2537)